MEVKGQNYVVGVDVGGTKVAAAAVDSNGHIFGRTRLPTPIGVPEQTLDAIAAAVRTVMDETRLQREGIQGIGVGVPGLVEPETGMAVASVNLEWRNVPVRSALEARLGIPCTIENDVNAAALGEIRYGAARGLQNIIYLVVGTGIAAGIVIDGKLYRGAHGMAGEIGHAILRPGGPPCKCGARGCMEALISGPALAGRAGRQWTTDTPATSLRQRNPSSGVPSEVAAEDLFAAVREGDNTALTLLSDVGADLAFALQFLLLAFDPEMIVLGGGVMESGEMMLPFVLDALERQAEASWVFASVFDRERFRVSEIQADISILGAAALVTQQ